MPLAERRDPDCARESGAVLRGCLAAAWLPLLGCRCLAAVASDRGRSVLRWAERRNKSDVVAQAADVLKFVQGDLFPAPTFGHPLFPMFFCLQNWFSKGFPNCVNFWDV